MFQGDAHHGTSKDTDPRRDRAIVIAHQHPQVLRAEQIHDAPYPLDGPAHWRGGRTAQERRHHYRRAGEKLNPPAARHDQGPTCAHGICHRQTESGTASLCLASDLCGPKLPILCQPKSIRTGFSANSLAQTFALIYKGAGLEGDSSHSGRRTFLTNLANKGTAIHILKTLAWHRSISTTAAYLYSCPNLLKAAVEFA